jgi:hypothetical protein
MDGRGLYLPLGEMDERRRNLGWLLIDFVLERTPTEFSFSHSLIAVTFEVFDLPRMRR